MPAAVAASVLLLLTILSAGTFALGSLPWWGTLNGEIDGQSLLRAILASRLLRTALAGVVVGSLGTLMAWPVARATWNAPASIRAICLLPMLMPVYLVPGAWRTLLDPSSPIGDWIIRRSQGDGPNLAILVDQALAILGLAIWTSPLAWGVLVGAWRAIDPAELDALRMHPMSRTRRLRFLIRRTRPAIVRSIILGALVMGSQVVPFDLARIDTVGNAVRVSMSLARPERALLQALPWLLIGLVAATWVAWGAVRRGSVRSCEFPIDRVRPSRAAAAWAMALCGLGVLLPALVLSLSMRSLGSIARFLDHAGVPLRDSLIHAGISGFIFACLAGACSIAAIRTRGLVVICSAVFGVLALMPGVMLGAGAARAASEPWIPDAIADSPAIWHVALLARHGVLACLIGLWLRANDSRELGDVLRSTGVTWRAWLRADIPRHLPAIVGSGLIASALALHEVEVGVMLRPIGTDAIAPLMLELLHYQRRDDLAAGVLLVLLPSVVLAGLGLLLVLRRRGRGD